MQAEQQSLFDEPYQDRAKCAEPEQVYFAVLKLRRLGCTVMRHGRTQNKVDGRIMSNSELIEFAWNFL